MDGGFPMLEPARGPAKNEVAILGVNKTIAASGEILSFVK